MLTSDLDYHLPKSLIANSPASPRDHSRLMVINRKTGKIESHIFYEIEKFLGSNDVLVLNKTKVFPARFFGNKDFLRLRSGRSAGGGRVEVLLVEEIKTYVWKALTSPGLKEGQKIEFKNNIFECIGHDGISVLLKISISKAKLFSLLSRYGHTPLPPYIKNADPETKLRRAYQTVYAQNFGSVAAPTAGFHFTKNLLTKLKKKGVQIEYITLHVGLGTFLPVKTKILEKHEMHSEYFDVDKSTANRLINDKNSGKRIVAVGTTSVRVLESLPKTSGHTKIFIYPGYKFKMIDCIITNFHLPHSTLLALIYAFAGKQITKKAYKKAIRDKYRFYSFGDACFIV